MFPGSSLIQSRNFSGELLATAHREQARQETRIVKSCNFYGPLGQCEHGVTQVLRCSLDLFDEMILHVAHLLSGLPEGILF